MSKQDDKLDEIFGIDDCGKGPIKIIDITITGEEPDGGFVSTTRLYEEHIKSAILANFVSKQEIREALEDEQPYYGGDKPDWQVPEIRNKFRATLRKRWGL
jgi:hypothetical protein